mmetsp:Transcript_41991/g.131520  ORF Transcript_41991/g.131520 Transcript_41991/m.131520 type:complete len:220 (+) Transcript_41991:1734-2393(+)
MGLRRSFMASCIMSSATALLSMRRSRSTSSDSSTSLEIWPVTPKDSSSAFLYVLPLTSACMGSTSSWVRSRNTRISSRRSRSAMPKTLVVPATVRSSFMYLSLAMPMYTESGTPSVAAYARFLSRCSPVKVPFTKHSSSALWSIGMESVWRMERATSSARPSAAASSLNSACCSLEAMAAVPSVVRSTKMAYMSTVSLAACSPETRKARSSELMRRSPP